VRLVYSVIHRADASAITESDSTPTTSASAPASAPAPAPARAATPVLTASKNCMVPTSGHGLPKGASAPAVHPRCPPHRACQLLLAASFLVWFIFYAHRAPGASHGELDQPSLQIQASFVMRCQLTLKQRGSKLWRMTWRALSARPYPLNPSRIESRARSP